jgi:hypothetical protein
MPERAVRVRPDRRATEFEGERPGAAARTRQQEQRYGQSI